MAAEVSKAAVVGRSRGCQGLGACTNVSARVKDTPITISFCQKLASAGSTLISVGFGLSSLVFA